VEKNHSIILICLVIAGCYSGNEGSATSRLGAIHYTTPATADIRIVEPAELVRAQARGKIDCRIMLTVPEGGALPTSVRADWISGSKSIPAGTFEINLAKGREYDLHCKIRLPPKRGLYRLRVDAAYLVFRGQTGEEKSSNAFEWMHRFEWGPKTEVIP
jgi:hypothetical protein